MCHFPRKKIVFFCFGLLVVFFFSSLPFCVNFFYSSVLKVKRNILLFSVLYIFMFL